MTILPGLADMHVHLMILGHGDYEHWDTTYRPRFRDEIMTAAARQLVTHGHFEVNVVRVDVPSYRVEQYDIITVRKQSTEKLPIQLARETFGDRPTPAWIQVVPGSLQILIHSLPVRAQIDTILTEQLIVEFYSKN